MSKDEATLEFDAGIREAYDAMGPTQEAKMRVRARLEEERRAYAANASRPRRRALIILPLAAGIAAIAVVVSIGMLSSATTSTKEAAIQPNTMARESEERQPDVAASGGTAKEMAAEEGSASGAVNSTDAAPAAAPYPTVALDSGETYEVGARVDVEPAPNSFESARALDESGNMAVECTVAQRRYVRFAGDEAWYELAPST